MRLGIIGAGAIGDFVRKKVIECGHDIRIVMTRSDRVADLPDDIDLMIDCAGHMALRDYGPDILRRGIDVLTVSIGALADAKLCDELHQAAADGGAKLHLASGAIGALDCLQAARVGDLREVTYVGRKPPQGWRGSPAEEKLDLDNLTTGAVTHFEGSARDAAIQYPKNANVAAAVAIAGSGFDDTQVELIADPTIAENIHEIRASGDFGSFTFEIRGHSLPDNPRSSALAAMSVISKLDEIS